MQEMKNLARKGSSLPTGVPSLPDAFESRAGRGGSQILLAMEVFGQAHGATRRLHPQSSDKAKILICVTSNSPLGHYFWTERVLFVRDA